MQTKKHFSALAALAVTMLLLAAWSAWQCFALPKIRLTMPGVMLVDSVLVKGFVWAVIPVLLLRLFRHSPTLPDAFRTPFPWLPCLVAVALSTAFLHTLRLFNGLMHTRVFFDWGMILLSVTAGVYEEIGFRGFLFRVQDAALGFWPAALLNGLLFTLYHYPNVIVGNLAGLLSLRSLLIFAMGVLFCWMLKRWKNLAMLIVVHTVWDLMSYLFCLS